MSKISSVSSSGVSRTSGIGPSISGGSPPIGGVRINESFNFPEIDLPERDKSSVALEERLYRNALIALFLEIVRSGINIVPAKPRDHGGYVVEASFSPAKSKGSNPIIKAPLRGVFEPLIAPLSGIVSSGTEYVVTEYVDKIVIASTDADILRLIIVIGHEFGHYISSVRGFHDQDLQVGLHLMHSKQTTVEAAKFTWLVFREESTAWLHAKQVLKRIKFEDWAIFDKVKNDSLSTYLSALNLEKADLSIYYKLSLLGDDFLKNTKSDLFKKMA